MERLISTLIFFLFFSTGASAATFTSWSTFGSLGCEQPVQDSAPVSSYCGSATLGALTAETYGAAGDGAVSAYASAYSTRTTEGVGTFYNNSDTFAIIRDTITATYSGTGVAFSGTAIFDIDLLGSIAADSGTSATSRANLQVDGISLYSFDSATDSTDAVTQVSFDYTGAFSIFVSISAEARSCSIIASGTTCYAVADLGSSLRLTGLSFFDLSGADVTSQLLVTSDSGFDYVTGAESHNRSGPNVVPLPAGAWLILSGLVGLGSMRVLRKRKTHPI